MQMDMQANLNDNNAKQCKKGNLIYERKYDSKLIWNARMKHDDESYGCMIEEEKKREVAMKLQCPNPKAEILSKSLSKPTT